MLRWKTHTGTKRTHDTGTTSMDPDRQLSTTYSCTDKTFDSTQHDEHEVEEKPNQLNYNNHKQTTFFKKYI